MPSRPSFVVEGPLCDAEWLHDHYVDNVLYAMLSTEWLRCA